MVLTPFESDQYSSVPKEISKLPLMYMTGIYQYISDLVHDVKVVHGIF